MWLKSITDVITNSSTEVFKIATWEGADLIENNIKEVLNMLGLEEKNFKIVPEKSEWLQDDWYEEEGLEEDGIVIENPVTTPATDPRFREIDTKHSPEWYTCGMEGKFTVVWEDKPDPRVEKVIEIFLGTINGDIHKMEEFLA